MKKSAEHVLFFLFLLSLVVSSGAGTVYYVNGANGSDAGPGTQAYPWKTIQKAANTMRAGDGTIVSAGTYPERITASTSGTSGALITFLASGTVECRGFTVRADYVRLQGFKITTLPIQASAFEIGYGTWITGKYCIVENIFAYNCVRGGICLRPESANGIVRNNRCQRNGMVGIEIHGTNHLVENNEIWGSICIPPPELPSSVDADGIRFFGSGHIFRGNDIHDITYDDPENIGYSPHIDGFQTWADQWHVSASNILFERNFIYLPVYKNGNAAAHGFMLRDCSYLSIRNNIVVCHGGTYSGEGTGTGTVHHLTLENNDFVGSLSFIPSFYPIGIDLRNCPYSTVKNNVVYNQVLHAIYLTGTTFTGLDIGYNCVYNSDGTIPYGTVFPHDLWAVNPLMVNPGSNDFHLTSGSPCINAGADIASLTEDFDGLPRPSGTHFDIGAYEYQFMAPSITAQPQSQSIQSGQTAALSVTAAGIEPFTYQWYSGLSGSSSTLVSGGTTSSFTTPALTQTANYWVSVRNAYGNIDSQTATITVAIPATVATAAVTNITQTAATSGGTVSSDGGSAVTERGVCWSISSNPTVANTKLANGSGTGSFTSTLTGLTPSTTYHVRAYAINASGSAYGQDLSFTTLSDVLLPTVATAAVTNITQAAAASGGTVGSDGGSAVTERGVCWSISSNPTVANTKLANGSGTGSFTSTLTGLTPSTTYHVRAYAINASGTAYGQDLSFTTLSDVQQPTVSTTAVTDISQTGAVSGGAVSSDGGSAVTARGVCWSTSPSPTVANTKLENGSGTGSFTSILTGLTPSRSYHLRAYAINASGIAYGKEVLFSTRNGRGHWTIDR